MQQGIQPGNISGVSRLFLALLYTILVVLTECWLNVYKKRKHQSGYVKADFHRGNLRRASLLWLRDNHDF
jgi:hypothetical protein